jgi:hypothetical protein
MKAVRLEGIRWSHRRWSRLGEGGVAGQRKAVMAGLRRLPWDLFRAVPPDVSCRPVGLARTGPADSDTTDDRMLRHRVAEGRC